MTTPETDTGTGVVFLTVGAIAAILSPNDEPKDDSRSIIFTVRSDVFSRSQSRRSPRSASGPLKGRLNDADRAEP